MIRADKIAQARRVVELANRHEDARALLRSVSETTPLTLVAGYGTYGIVGTVGLRISGKDAESILLRLIEETDAELEALF